MKYQYKILGSDPEKVFQQTLESKGLKYTKQRRLVLHYILRSAGHIGPEEIYRELKRLDRSIGRATIFRTLHLLSESGFANKIAFADGHSRYEFKFGRPHHDHMICINCGGVIEFSESAIERMQNKLAKKHSFSPVWHRHEIFGRCRKCR